MNILAALLMSSAGSAPDFSDIDALIRAELAVRKIPAMSVAVCDDKAIVWSAGYGHTDSGRTTPVTADSRFRAGEITRLVTALTALRLVEQGKLKLDAPVKAVLPDFRHTVTLRQLLTHKSSLPMEPPIGSCYDPGQPTLANIVASLNGISADHTGEEFSRSNAAFAVIGQVIATATGRPFEDVARDEVLVPLKADSSGFGKGPCVAGRAETVFGRELTLGDGPMANLPARGLYASATDLARIAQALVRKGKDLIRAESYDIALTASDVVHRENTNDAVPWWFIRSNSVPGFAGEVKGSSGRWAVVVLIAEQDGGPFATKISLAIGKRMDDHRVGRAKVPAKSVTSKPDESPIKGDYSVIRDMPYIRIVPNGDRYWRLPLIGGTVSIEPNSKLPAELSRMSETKPINAPNHWLGLIGEYGPESDPAYVFEDRGQLCLLVGRRTYLPLRELGLDSYWSDSRLNWDGTPVKFTRDESNRALAFTLAGIRFDRRNLPGEGAPVFKIQPERPVEQLLAESRKATPPPMRGEFAKPDLVDLSTLDPTLKFDIRYATADNFLGTPVYPVARALLQRPAADALVRVHKGLERDGYGLIIHDAYRPWHITKVFWDATPKVHHGFVADPLTGSRHNRGCAVDLSLYDRATGRTVEMTSGYDEFSDRAYPNYPGGTSLARWQRDKLRSAMEAEGFTVFSAEWWHFDYRDWKKYPVQNEPLEKPLR